MCAQLTAKSILLISICVECMWFCLYIYSLAPFGKELRTLPFFVFVFCSAVLACVYFMSCFVAIVRGFVFVVFVFCGRCRSTNGWFVLMLLLSCYQS